AGARGARVLARRAREAAVRGWTRRRRQRRHRARSGAARAGAHGRARMARSAARLDRARCHTLAHRRRLRQCRVSARWCARMSEIVSITGLGAEGDGAATTAAGAQIFIPQALPGETWRIAEGKPPEPVTLLSDRRRPPN